MRSSLLRLLCFASFAWVVKSQADPAYAVLLQRVISSLPTMIQTQLEGNPEKLERILSKILGDGLLGKLLSDPIAFAQKVNEIESKDKNAEGGDKDEDGPKKLWSSVIDAAASGRKNVTTTMPPTIATSPVASVQPSLAELSSVVDEKKLAEALLEALKKSITPSPPPTDYLSSVLKSRTDYSSDGSSGEYLVPTRREEFRRAPPSQTYRYGRKYSPSEQQILDEVNRDALLSYANSLRNQQTGQLANQQQYPLDAQASPLAASPLNIESLTPEEAIRVHEILNAYDVKLGRRQSHEYPRTSALVQSEDVDNHEQQPQEPDTESASTQTMQKGGRGKSVSFPDLTTSEPAETSSNATTTVDAEDSSDESETLASAFRIMEPQLAEIDSECECVPLDLEMMKGDWVQALGNTENVKQIYKGALHMMHENSADFKPTCARFKFESATPGRAKGFQQAKLSWTFKTSDEGKPITLQGVVLSIEQRTLQLQLEGPNSYKFNLPVCAQKTGKSEDGTRYNYVVLAETIGKDKCRSAHVLVRNPAAFFHERNEELINFLKSRIEDENMKPVSVVPFGNNCD
uniref:Uncharacterized protein n=1 Tax=Plectus sambesii TaxID=2011161 RepID=A0A914WCU9_9BILA